MQNLGYVIMWGVLRCMLSNLARKARLVDRDAKTVDLFLRSTVVNGTLMNVSFITAQVP
jgi:hypothetical protein